MISRSAAMMAALPPFQTTDEGRLAGHNLGRGSLTEDYQTLHAERRMRERLLVGNATVNRHGWATPAYTGH